MSAHLTVPAWGAASWVMCSYWPTALRDNPEETTPDRILGRCAHVVASNILRGTPMVLDQQIPDQPGQVVTQEMIDAATMFAKDVIATCNGQPLYIEQTLQAQGDLAPVGTVKPDVFCWAAPNHLVAYEFKMGREFVPAFSNWQLLLYARVILDAWEIDGLQEQNLTVEFRVVQPRNYDREGHVRSWTANAAQLRAFWNILATRAQEAVGPAPIARTGTSQCHRCPGRAKCSTFQRHAYQEASLAGDGTPFALDANALGLELRALEDARAILDARITGLEEEARARIIRGEAVNGYTTERSPGREGWRIPDTQVGQIGTLYGLDLMRSKPITPKQARDAGLPADVVNQYSDRTPSEPKLIRIENSQARKIFGRSQE